VKTFNIQNANAAKIRLLQFRHTQSMTIDGKREKKPNWPNYTS
jgi:hypothetical protein